MKSPSSFGLYPSVSRVSLSLCIGRASEEKGLLEYGLPPAVAIPARSRGPDLDGACRTNRCLTFHTSAAASYWLPMALSHSLHCASSTRSPVSYEATGDDGTSNRVIGSEDQRSNCVVTTQNCTCSSTHWTQTSHSSSSELMACSYLHGDWRRTMGIIDAIAR